MNAILKYYKEIAVRSLSTTYCSRSTCRNTSIEIPKAKQTEKENRNCDIAK